PRDRESDPREGRTEQDHEAATGHRRTLSAGEVVVGSLHRRLRFVHSSLGSAEPASGAPEAFAAPGGGLPGAAAPGGTGRGGRPFSGSISLAAWAVAGFCGAAFLAGFAGRGGRVAGWRPAKGSVSSTGAVPSRPARSWSATASLAATSASRLVSPAAWGPRSR